MVKHAQKLVKHAQTLVKHAQKQAAKSTVRAQGTRKRKAIGNRASGTFGVHAKERHCQVRVSYDGEHHYLGCFNTKQGAALAYDCAARQCGQDMPSLAMGASTQGGAAGSAVPSHVDAVCAKGFERI
jgi:hypothetical protein